MRTRLFITALALAAAGSAFAQEPPAEKPAENPDYSKPTLMRVFSADEKPPVRPRRVKVTLAGLEFRALGMDWRIGFMPVMPMAGSRHTTSKEWPDAFSLTGTQFASPPRTWRQQRALSAELRRIERLDRKRAKVVVK
jgi:hypothetical protein